MEIDDNNYKKPSQYSGEIESYLNGIDILLGDMKKYYILAKMYPANEEYQEKLSVCINDINSVLSNLFVLSNELQVNIDTISEELVKTDKSIDSEKQLHLKLKRHMTDLKDKSNASKEMINDYKKEYDLRYLRNWALLLSSILCIYAISKFYSNNPANMPVVK